MITAVIQAMEKETEKVRLDRRLIMMEQPFRVKELRIFKEKLKAVETVPQLNKTRA